jgi:hypothetical protein
VGEHIASLILFVNKTYSASGRVQLVSPDPDAEPSVAFNLLSDSRDVERLMDGFRRLGGSVGYACESQTDDKIHFLMETSSQCLLGAAEECREHCHRGIPACG